MITFDEDTNIKTLRLGVAALKEMRGSSRPLDRLLDAIPSRPVAHAAEEALLTHGCKLWSKTGNDLDLISDAIKSLNFCIQKMRVKP